MKSLQAQCTWAHLQKAVTGEMVKPADASR